MKRYIAIGTCMMNDEKIGVRVKDKVDCRIYDIPISMYDELEGSLDKSKEHNVIKVLEVGDKIITGYEMKHGFVGGCKLNDSRRYIASSVLRDIKKLTEEGWKFDVAQDDLEKVMSREKEVITGKKDMFVIQFDLTMLSTGFKYHVVRVWGYNVRLSTPPIINTYNIEDSYRTCSICGLKKSKLRKVKFSLVCNECIENK